MNRKVVYVALAVVAVLGLVLAMLPVLGLANYAFLSRAEESPQLEFEVAIHVDQNQEVRVELGVHNAGKRTFEGTDRFNGWMELRRVPSDELRASAEVIPLRSLAPDETVWPMDWHSQLEPGTYRVIWGAEEYGSTVRQFTITEEGGRLYLGEGELTPLAPEEPNHAAMAVSDLAERLGISPEAITVQSIEPTEFPDASLGVPEPGKSYAQVVTPGYIIRLEANGERYEYHAAGERVVFVPQEDEEGVSDALSYQRIDAPELGLTFEVPATWERLEPELAWAPEARSDLRLAVNGMTLNPPMEQEAALLPNHAQIVDSQPVDLGWAEGRRFTLEVYGPAAEGGEQAPVASVQTHVLVTLEQGDARLAFDFYAVAPTAEALETLASPLQRMLDSAQPTEAPQASTPSEEQGGADGRDFLVFEDEAYGFRLRYPQDWVYQEVEAQLAGPDDWPVKRIVNFFPQAWAERFEQDGPPDPEALPAVPAIILEVCVGSLEQFRRVYPEPMAQEALQVNGVTAVRELEGVAGDVRLIRYVFTDPNDETLRVVLSDALSGLSDQHAGQGEVAARIPEVVGTFAFIE
jgi:hypothetical protein